ARAVVVGPDDLINEGRTPEEPVEEHLHVVHLARVEVHEEAARRRQEPSRFSEARLEEREIIDERVTERARSELLRGVAPPAKPRAVARRVAFRTKLRPALRAPRVERGVDVDEIERRAREPREHVQVVALTDFDHVTAASGAPGGTCPSSGPSPRSSSAAIRAASSAVHTRR